MPTKYPEVALTVTAPLQTLPRELHQWIQTLNLSYKITNPKRDLSNGWVFAEILQRYYPDDIEMYQFDNGFKLEKKQNNWVHLSKFAKRKNLDITVKDFEPVIHCAPNAALSLLKKIYTILTEKVINDEPAEVQQQQLKDEMMNRPEYLRATITQKMKEHEIQRIEDKVHMTHTALNIANDHVNKRKDERFETGFNKTRQTGYFAHKQMQQTLRNTQIKDNQQQNQQTIDGVPIGDIKPVTVKTVNKQIRQMRQETKNAKNSGGQADEDSDEQALEQILTEIIGRTLTNKLNKMDPEYKVFKEHSERGITYFQDRYQYIPDELVVDIFLALQDQVNDIVVVLSKSMMDLPELLSFFASALKQVNPTLTSKGSGSSQRSSQRYNILNLMVETLTVIANKLLNLDPLQTEIYFLEYGLQELLDVMAANTFKMNEMAVLCYCFVQSTNNSHYRVLNKISEKMSTHDNGRQVLPFLLAHLFLFESEKISGEVYSIYYEHALRGLHHSSAVTRTKCITILSYLSRIRLEPILPILPLLEKQSTESSWELQGQLLILASNGLVQFNQDRVVGQESQLENEEKTEKKGATVLRSSIAQESSVISQNVSQRKARDFQTNSLQTAEIDTKTIEECTPVFFKIISTIFKNGCPKATTKIGLIYLAKIINYYPEFTKKYLEVLLGCPENIRQSILEIRPLPGTEEEVYVSGANTEKYRTYGAPMEWNSLSISKELQKTVLSEGLEVLEQAHIEIFDAAIQQDFKEEDLSEWLDIIFQMKSHFMISLCYRDFSQTAIRILQKFFFHSQLQSKVLPECQKILIKTLSLVYQPDTDSYCKENVKEFLESLHSGGADESQESSEQLKEFVYNVIKAFAKENSDAYLYSNLIDLMNHVVEKRRVEIFQPELSASQLSSGKKDDRRASSRPNLKK